MWNDSIQLINSYKFGIEQAWKTGKKGKRAILHFLQVWSLLFNPISNLSLLLPTTHPVYITAQNNFIPKLKIMPIPFIFSCDSITSKNNEEGEYGDFREKNNV